MILWLHICIYDLILCIYMYSLNLFSYSLNLNVYIENSSYLTMIESGIYLFILIHFISGSTESLLLCVGLLWMWQAGPTLLCAGFSVCWFVSWRTGSRCVGLVVGVAYAGSNPCPPHWQVDFKLLDHQGSPRVSIYWTTTDSFWRLHVPTNLHNNPERQVPLLSSAPHF